MGTKPVILDAACGRSMIRGTPTAATGERREFHGWLELGAALEAMLATEADRVSSIGPPRRPQ